MNRRDILDSHFDALVQSPGGVDKLRQLILQMAVQGKLVPQDPNDEPASVLLEKIKKEKEQLIKKGKIKKAKPLPPISYEEIPYPIPTGWEWVRLVYLCEIITKGSSPKWQGVNYAKREEGILFITSENVGNFKLLLQNKEKYVEKKFQTIEPRSILRTSDILMNIVGASIGRAALFNLNVEANINQAVCLIRLIGNDIFLYNRYLLYFFNNPSCINLMFRKQVDNARANLSMGNISAFPVPFPPFAEQKRIVEKVDSLMALCDQLEAKQNEGEKVRVNLNTASLSRLTGSLDPDQFRDNWQDVADRFNTLYTQPGNVSQLKKAILQLAVMGKLVPQDPNDEPASVLLEKIKKEKQKLIKEKKIKEQESLLPITSDEIPYPLPKGWEWIKIDEVCEYIQRGKSPKYVEKSAVPVISQKCIQWDGFNIERARFIDTETLHKYNSNRFIRTGDLLWNSTGTGTLGRINVFSKNEVVYDKIVADSHVTVLRPLFISSKFIYIFIRSPIVQNNIDLISSGSTKQKELSTSAVRNHLISIPPLAEQKRIVEKVDHFMAICDKLETGLSSARETVSALFDALLNQL